MATATQYINAQFHRGIEDWSEYEPKGSGEASRIYKESLVSRVFAVVGEESLFVTGTLAEPPDSSAMEVFIFTPTVVVRVLDGAGTNDAALVDVFGRRQLSQIRVSSAPLVSSTDLLRAGSGSLEFDLHYPFGRATVTRYCGSEDDRRKWLQAFSEDLNRE